MRLDSTRQEGGVPRRRHPPLSRYITTQRIFNKNLIGYCHASNLQRHNEVHRVLARCNASTGRGLPGVTSLRMSCQTCGSGELKFSWKRYFNLKAHGWKGYHEYWKCMYCGGGWFNAVKLEDIERGLSCLCPGETSA